MSRLRLNAVSQPNTPSAGKIEIYHDTADNKLSAIDSDGYKQVLTEDGWRQQNLIINGDFSFAQRQVPTTLTNNAVLAGGRTYAFDRMFQSNAGGSVVIQTQQVNNLGGAEVGIVADSYAKYKVTGAVSKVAVGQVIESANMNHLLGMKVRVQCKMKYSVAASMAVRFGLVQLTGSGTSDTVPAGASGFITAFGGTGTDPTLGTNLAYITPNLAENGTIVGSAVDINLTNAWVRYSATFTIPSTSKNLIPMIWTNAALSVNDELNITEFGLFAGEEIRDWHPRTVALSFNDCTRYYEKSFPLLIAPAASVTAANGGLGSVGMGGKATTGANGVVIGISYKTQKRIAVTPTLFTPVAAGAQAYRHNGTTPAIDTGTAIVTSSATALGFAVVATGDANAAIGDLHGVHWTADAEI